MCGAFLLEKLDRLKLKRQFFVIMYCLGCGLAYEPLSRSSLVNFVINEGITYFLNLFIFLTAIGLVKKLFFTAVGPVFDIFLFRLRDRLVKIITDYRTETSLRHGCNDILKADCVNLLIKYYKEARRAIYLSNEEDEARARRDEGMASQSTENLPNTRTMVEVKSKTRGGGRCCICFDPFSLQNVSIITFFCCHAYHATCLSDTTNSVSGKKGAGATSHETVSYYEYGNGDVDDDEDDDDTASGAPRIRCILCTTAAG